MYERTDFFPNVIVTDVYIYMHEDPLEKEMGTHSNILPGESHGKRSLLGYNPWGHKRVGHDLVTKQQQQALVLT